MCTKDRLLDFLRQELTPALGCTEPAAVALAAAHARQAVGGRVQKVRVKADPNVYKNGMGVYVPGADDYGLDVAAALGAIGGDPSLELQALKAVTAEHVAEMKSLVDSGMVDVEPWGEPGFLYIMAEVITDRGVGVAEIAGKHNNLVLLLANDTVLYKKPFAQAAPTDTSGVNLTLAEIWQQVDACCTAELEFLLEGAQMNYQAALQGIEHRLGLSLGARLLDLIEQEQLAADLPNILMAYTAAAADARMSGWPAVIMSTGGSGNQGITASVPVYVAAKERQVPHEKLLRALALSQLVTLYVKQHIGRLSAICACAIAASVGASAGVTYLLGGSLTEVECAVKNMAANLTGVICDGAKEGCSLKLATAVCTAAQMALLSLQGMSVSPNDGIVAESADETIRNIGRISNPGMRETDKIILQVMMEKHTGVS